MNKKLKLAAGALSAALMITAVGGSASLTSGQTQGVEVQAATRKSEAQLRKIVTSKYPGTVLGVYKDYDDGRWEYKYTIQQGNGRIIKVEITEYGYITDVDFEGYYSNGKYYDDDYYDNDWDDDYYDWD